MGTTESKQPCDHTPEQAMALPERCTELNLRRLGGICYAKAQFAFAEVAQAPDATPVGSPLKRPQSIIPTVAREDVLRELERLGLDTSQIFWANLRHFFDVRMGLDEAWASVPNSDQVVGGIAAQDRLKDDEKDGRHEGFFCDGCDAYPIVGVRWSCDICGDFDLCDSCKVNDPPQHHNALLTRHVAQGKKYDGSFRQRALTRGGRAS